MKFEIITNFQPISVEGKLDPIETHELYEYRIDGKVVPPSLARIIELGLAVQFEQYCRGYEKEMEFIRKLKEGK